MTYCQQKYMCCKLKWTHKYAGSACCAPLNGCVYCTHTVNKMGVLSTQGTCCVHTVNKRYILCTYYQHKVHLVHTLKDVITMPFVCSQYFFLI